MEQSRVGLWRLLPVVALLVAAVPALAAEPRTEQLLSLSLNELLQVNVSTASIQPLPMRSQPGIVSVITADDMVAAGARSLQDVLLMVPGVSFGIDVFNVPGLVFRGTWAYEGKILFLVDDIPVNDLLYGIYTLPPNFPVELLQRVEVLRGPGGAKYGENAQLAVIRIYTRNRAQHEGFAAVTMAAQQDGVPLGQVSAGGQWQGAQGSMSAVGTVSSSGWGTGTWTDAAGQRFDTSTQELQSAQLAAAGEWRGTRIQLYLEDFRIDAAQRYGYVQPDMDLRFQDTNVRVEHDFQLSPSTTLTPRWTWRGEDAWHGESALPSNYELPAQRHTLELEVRHGFAGGALLRAGVQQYWAEVEARQMDVPDAFPGQTPANYFDGSPGARMRSISAFAESEVALRRYLLSAGLRYSDHSAGGDALVPRLMLTRAEADWHVKAGLESAFREPQFEPENQRASALESETTTLHELEVGHRVGERQYVTASAFRYELRDAIVFSVAPSGIPGYVNGAHFHGEGVDLQWRWQREGWHLEANYQRSRTDDDAIPVYDVTGRRGRSLGAPRDVANLWLGWQVTPAWSLHPRLRYQGVRTALVHDPDSSAAPALRQAELDAEFTVDIAARFRRGHWTTDFGVRNATDEERLLPQPYSGISPPYPAGGSEAWMRLQYDF